MTEADRLEEYYLDTHGHHVSWDPLALGGNANLSIYEVWAREEDLSPRRIGLECGHQMSEGHLAYLRGLKRCQEITSDHLPNINCVKDNEHPPPAAGPSDGHRINSQYLGRTDQSTHARTQGLGANDHVLTRPVDSSEAPNATATSGISPQAQAQINCVSQVIRDRGLSVRHTSGLNLMCALEAPAGTFASKSSTANYSIA